MRYRLKKLEQSIKNKEKHIPSGYDDRIKALLDSLPDEVPVSKGTEAKIIQRTKRFDIKPFLSAAAVFALVFSCVLVYPKFSQTASDKNHNKIIITKTTTTVTPAVSSTEEDEQTTSSLSTTSISKNEVLETLSDPDASEEHIQAGAVPAVTEIPSAVPHPVSTEKHDETKNTELPKPPHEQKPEKTGPVPPAEVPPVSPPQKNPAGPKDPEVPKLPEAPKEPDSPEKPQPGQPPEHEPPEHEHSEHEHPVLPVPPEIDPEKEQPLPEKKDAKDTVLHPESVE
ncbi:MAG: hypothetical protein E7505_06795 [Ruminococcus sp.]|nr:hypothetical protein [Ruminococcus sp.]